MEANIHIPNAVDFGEILHASPGEADETVILHQKTVPLLTRGPAEGFKGREFSFFAFIREFLPSFKRR